MIHQLQLIITLHWRHNERNGVSNHQPYDYLLNRLYRRRSEKTSKLLVTGLCAGNSLVTGEFPPQMVSRAENVSIWWLHHVYNKTFRYTWPSNKLPSIASPTKQVSCSEWCISILPWYTDYSGETEIIKRQTIYLPPLLGHILLPYIK